MEKNNKLIAEFMGMNVHHNDKSMMVTKTPQGNEVIPIDSLQYHTDWNWLMSVIEKIAELYIENPQLDYQSYDNIRFCVPSLQDTYQEVLNFIKDYNYAKQQ